MGYECWNLASVQMNDFLSSVRRRIPPMNENVLKNYGREAGGANRATWHQWRGLRRKNVGGGCCLRPRSKRTGERLCGDCVPCGRNSPCFLNPVFYLSDFRESIALIIVSIISCTSTIQNQARLFKRGEFVEFYKTLISESGYGVWQARRGWARWDMEDMRVFCGVPTVQRASGK